MRPSSKLSEAERVAIETKRRDALERRNRNVQAIPTDGIKRQCIDPAAAGFSFLTLNMVRQEPPIHHQLSAKTCRSKPMPTSSSEFFGRGSRVVNSKGCLPKSSMPQLSFITKLTTAKCVLISKERFEVQTKYHAGLMIIFKALPTHQYDHSNRKWNFHLSDYKSFLSKVSAIADIQLEGLSSAVVTTFKSQIEDSKNERDMMFDMEKVLTERLPRSLVESLMTFQKEGVGLAIRRNGRVLLADDMGLGKTLQGLAIAVAFRSEWPLLIVTPSSVRFAWREQIMRWLGETLSLHRSEINVVTSARAFTSDGYSNLRDSNHSLITIFSYDLLSRCAVRLSQLAPFRIVIMDESHFLKNFKTARTKAAMPILKAAKRVILLTGTPALSRPSELFCQINAVNPTLFKGGFHEFGLRYCAAKENAWGWDYSGCSNMAELQLVLEETIMIRRVKSEVLCQLPPKRREVVVLDPGLIKTATIQHIKTDFCNIDLKAMEKHGELLRYFMETSRIKIPAVEQYITDLLESERKFLLFAHHQEMLNALSRLLTAKSTKFIRIDGKTPSDQRQILCDRFQSEEACKVALLSITAASTGIHLTAASFVVFAELFWNPGMLIQAEDRAYRIGQQDSVSVQYLLAEDTADTHIWSLVKTKLDVLTKAGLNQESFDDMGLTHFPAKVQTLDAFLVKEKPPVIPVFSPAEPEDTFNMPASLVAEFEKPLTVVPTYQTTLLDTSVSRLVSHDRLSRHRRLSPLFLGEGPHIGSQFASRGNLSGERRKVNEQNILVPSSSDDSADESPIKKTVTVDNAVVDRATTISDDDPGEDSLLFHAAEAAETAWLTEALLTDTAYS